MYFYSSLKYFRHIVYILVILFKSIARHKLPQNVDDWSVEILTNHDVRTLEEEDINNTIFNKIEFLQTSFDKNSSMIKSISVLIAPSKLLRPNPKSFKVLRENLL